MQGLASRPGAYRGCSIDSPPKPRYGTVDLAATQQHDNERSGSSSQLHVKAVAANAESNLAAPYTGNKQQQVYDEQGGSLHYQCVLLSHPVASSTAQPPDSFDTSASCSLDSASTTDSSTSNVLGASDSGASSSQVPGSNSATTCRGHADSGSWFVGRQLISPECQVHEHDSIVSRSASTASKSALGSSVSSHDRTPVNSTPCMSATTQATHTHSLAQHNTFQACPPATTLPCQGSTQVCAKAEDKHSCTSQPTSLIPCLAAIMLASGSNSGGCGTPTIAATLAHSQQLHSSGIPSCSGSPQQASQTTSKPSKRHHPRASLQLPEAAHVSVARRSVDVSDGGRRAGQRGAGNVRGSTLFCLLHTGSSDIRQPGSAFPPVRGINQSWSGCEPGMTVTGFDTQPRSRSAAELPSFRPATSAAVDIIGNACIFGSASSDPWVPMQALSELLAVGAMTEDAQSSSGSAPDGSSMNGSGGVSSALATRTTLASTTDSNNSDSGFSSSADDDSLCKEAPVYTAVKHYSAVMSTLPALPAISEHQSHHHHHHHHYHQAELQSLDPLAQQAQQQQAELASEQHAALLKNQQPHRHNQQHAQKQQVAAPSEPSLNSESSLGLSLESAISVSTQAPLPSLSNSLNHSNGQLCAMSDGQLTLPSAPIARSSSQFALSCGQLNLSSGQITALSSSLYGVQQPAGGSTRQGLSQPVASAANGGPTPVGHTAAALAAATASHTLDWTQQMQQWRTAGRRSSATTAPYLSAAKGKVTTPAVARSSIESVANVLSFADMGQLSQAVVPSSQISWPQQMSAWLTGAGEESYGMDPRTQWWGVSGFFSEHRTQRLQARVTVVPKSKSKSSPEVRAEVYCTMEQALFAIDDGERAQREGQGACQWRWPTFV